MKTVTVIAAAFCLLATAAAAQDSCKVQADGKNLHGAALTSFAKKCCKDQAPPPKSYTARRRRASPRSACPTLLAPEESHPNVQSELVQQRKDEDYMR